MDKQREQIKNIIEKLHNISKQPGKEWLLSELMVHFGNDAKITEIYEYCIENVLKNQAAEFYKDFPLRRIVPQLEKDFIRMETFRRQNKFEEFSMAVYQQIENITNEIWKDERLYEITTKMMNHPFHIEGKQHGKPIGELILIGYKSDKTIDKYGAMDLIYCVLYFLCYEAMSKYNKIYDFYQHKNLFNWIYQFRNLNHRNGKPSDSQKNIIETVNTNKSIYYFKFAEALLFYIEGVAKGLGKLDELHTYAMGEKKMDVKVVPKVVGKIDLSKFQTKRF